MNLRPQRRDQVSLDMTPLIDVVFLLLIFFMVSTTFDKQTAVKVDLPKAQSLAEKTQNDKIMVVVDARGHIYINDHELINNEVDTVKRTLLKAAGDNKETPVIIRVDKSAPFQAPMTVMDAAAQAALTHLSFVARQAGEQP